MTKTIIGDRPLSSMTEDELKNFLDLTGEYGSKSYWGEPIITHIDRYKNDHSITVWFKQIRISDNEVSDAYLNIDYDELTYYAVHYYPYQRMTDIKSITQNSKLFVYILSQGFNILEILPEGFIPSIKTNSSRKIQAEGYLIGDYMDLRYGNFRKKDELFFTNENELEAIRKYEEMKKEKYSHWKLYAIVPIEDLQPNTRVSEYNDANENNQEYDNGK